MSNHRLCDACRKHRGHQWPVTIGGKSVTVHLDGCEANSPDAGRIVMHDGIERPTDLCEHYETKEGGAR